VKIHICTLLPASALSRKKFLELYAGKLVTLLGTVARGVELSDPCSRGNVLGCQSDILSSEGVSIERAHIVVTIDDTEGLSAGLYLLYALDALISAYLRVRPHCGAEEILTLRVELEGHTGAMPLTMKQVTRYVTWFSECSNRAVGLEMQRGAGDEFAQHGETFVVINDVPTMETRRKRMMAPRRS